MDGVLSQQLARDLLSFPGPEDSKYSRGTVGFVTGSEKYPGAALLGISAAFELGIGMVRYLGPKSVTEFILSNRPEVLPGLEKAQVLVLGSGIAKDETSEQLANLHFATSQGLPMVIDAGAMNLVDYSKIISPAILTPHHGEAYWLLETLGSPLSKNEIAENPTVAALRIASLTDQVVLLKGHTSYIASPSGDAISTGPGSVHLATAGTGDVLAGVLGTFLALLEARGIALDSATLMQTCLIANAVHSAAADRAAQSGHFGASAVCDALSELRQK